MPKACEENTLSFLTGIFNTLPHQFFTMSHYILVDKIDLLKRAIDFHKGLRRDLSNNPMRHVSPTEMSPSLLMETKRLYISTDCELSALIAKLEAELRCAEVQRELE